MRSRSARLPSPHGRSRSTPPARGAAHRRGGDPAPTMPRARRVRSHRADDAAPRRRRSLQRDRACAAPPSDNLSRSGSGSVISFRIARRLRLASFSTTASLTPIAAAISFWVSPSTRRMRKIRRARSGRVEIAACTRSSS